MGASATHPLRVRMRCAGRPRLLSQPLTLFAAASRGAISWALPRQQCLPAFPFPSVAPPPFHSFLLFAIPCLVAIIIPRSDAITAPARAMEWGDRGATAVAEEMAGGREPLGYVKVMTDEQMEVLRKQISVYATICEQLVEMQRALTEHQDFTSGMGFSNLYCDPLIVPGGHKITARQRWQPTPMQLQILESIFDQGNGTPSKQKIKDITAELSHHGQISETNVYNWFQNRRARSKRKQAASLPNNAESEAEADEESITDTKPKSDMPLQQSKAMSIHNAGSISGIHHFETEQNQMGDMIYGSSDNNLRSSGGSGQMSFYENIMSNPSTFAGHYFITQHKKM